MCLCRAFFCVCTVNHLLTNAGTQRFFVVDVVRSLLLVHPARATRRARNAHTTSIKHTLDYCVREPRMNMIIKTLEPHTQYAHNTGAYRDAKVHINLTTILRQARKPPQNHPSKPLHRPFLAARIQWHARARASANAIPK